MTVFIYFTNNNQTHAFPRHYVYWVDNNKRQSKKKRRKETDLIHDGCKV